MAYISWKFWIKYFLYFFTALVLGPVLLGTIFFVLFGWVDIVGASILYIISFLIFSPILKIDKIYNYFKQRKKNVQGTTKKSNKEWLEKNYESLKYQYHNFYIAVYKRKVIDSDNNLDNLMKKLKINLQNVKDAYIHYIS